MAKLGRDPGELALGQAVRLLPCTAACQQPQVAPRQHCLTVTLISQPPSMSGLSGFHLGGDLLGAVTCHCPAGQCPLLRLCHAFGIGRSNACNLWLAEAGVCSVLPAYILARLGWSRSAWSFQRPVKHSDGSSTNSM